MNNNVNQTNIEEVKDLTNQYIQWLKGKTTFREIGQKWIEITTPYLDRHNDYIQIFVQKKIIIIYYQMLVILFLI